MRILLTNDDSISSSVLKPLAQWLRQFGEVTVVVPKYEQSGKSHGIEIHKAFEMLPTDFFPGVKAYTVDSTPADCVRFAIEGMGMEFDFVVSGINRGLNIGIDMIYSGTVGAIFEAGCYGIPGVALSTEPETFDHAMDGLDELKAFFEKHKLMEKNSLYNVNIPMNSKGILITRMGGRYFGDKFHPQENNMYLPVGQSVWKDSGNYELDTDAVLNGYTSILPLTLDRTNQKVFAELVGLNKHV